MPARLRSLALVALAVASVASLTMATPAARAAGRTLYVATNGRDFNNDGWSTPPNSITTPWASMRMAIRRALPGDTILVRGGTYREVAGWGAVAATATSPIRLEAYPGERVVLMGVLQLDLADYWTVKGINVTHDPALGRKETLVKFDGGTGWQFLDAEVWGTRGVSNMMVTGNKGLPRNYRIAGNCIHDNDAVGDPFMNDHNLYLMPGVSSGPGMIERNIFFNAENGGHIKAAPPQQSGGAARVTIRHNTMLRGAAGVIIGYDTHTMTLWRNLIGHQVGGNASYNAAVMGNHARGIRNTVTHLGTWGYGRSVKFTWDSQPITATSTVWLSPTFDNTTSCSGFHATDPVGSRYGRYSP